MNLPFPIPLQVLYAGLGGAVLALIVATISNRWSLKVFFLLALRLAIGWHFLFEGLHKVHSHYVGASETNRPFSSEIYFVAGEGPLAREMRGRIGIDPEKELQAKLTPQNADKLTALSAGARVNRRPNGEPHEPFPDFLAARRKELSDAVRQDIATDPAKAAEFARKAARDYAERQVSDLAAFSQMAPPEVRTDWNAFVKAFGEKYKLTPEEQQKLDGNLSEPEREQLIAGFQAAETPDVKERKELIDKAGAGDVTLTAMAAYGRWAVGAEARPSKLKFVSTGDAWLTAPQRLEYLGHRKAEVADLEKHAGAKLGVGYGHDMNRVRDVKAVVTAARAALLTDADEMLKDLKKVAVAETFGKRFTKKTPGPRTTFGGLDPDPDAPPPTPEQLKKAEELWTAKLDAIAALPVAGEPTFGGLPPDIKDVWGRYLAEFKAAYPMDDEATRAADEVYGLMTARLANWYHGVDEFSGKPPTWVEDRITPLDQGFVAVLKQYEAAKKKAAESPKAAEFESDPDAGWFADAGRRAAWQAEARRAKDRAAQAATAPLAARDLAYAGLERKYADLKAALTGAIPSEMVAGPVAEKPAKSQFLESLDWRTRWGITAIGIMLLAGLFTRIACLAGVAFLVMTYLTHPPFPWLPLPPGTEGNPLFVNKNVIEALALLVIMVHPTGRWLGIDAVIHRVFFRNSKEYVVPADEQPPVPTARKK